MERKKKRGKSLANGAEVDSAAGQSGDVQQRHREAEQQGNAKRLAACAPSSESPTQPFLSSLSWAYPPQQSVQQTPQQSTHASTPQTHVQPQQQQASQQGLQGVTQQPLPSGQQSASGWQNPEHSGQNAGAGHYPFHPGAADSNWQASNYGGAQGMGTTVPSFNHPSGFGFPPPPYPGLWDPASWWAHNTHQQAVFPYPFPGYGGGYAYPFPPATQRGLIKTPPGLSQKHRRLWEAQSMENVQLWAIVGRAEAEISCQRAKILKLEGDLQTIKAHQDALMDASAVANAPQSARRGRRKKVSPAPVATVGLPFSQPKRSRAQGRKAVSSRTNANKIEIAKNAKEIESEEKDKSTLTHHIPGLLNRSTQDHDQKSSSLTVGLNRSETGVERNSHKQHTVECQAEDNENPRLTGEKDDLDYSQVNQNSPFRSSLPVGAGKDKNCEQNMEMKEAPIISFLKSAGIVDKQALISGESALKSECTGMMRSNDWSGADGSGTARNIMLGARLQAYDAVGMERSNEVESGKTIPAWQQYTREDGSDEQDEVGASGQDDDEADDDDETTLDDIQAGKVGNYMVLDSTAMSKEMTTLNRW